MPNEELFPLTPAHLMLGRGMYQTSIDNAFSKTPELDIRNDHNSLLQKWRHRERLVQQFWTYFRGCYIHELQQQKKWHNKGNSPVIGDVCIEVDRKLKRGQWPLVKIIDIHDSKDGVHRVATVTTPSGNRVRAVRRLVKLEISPFDVLENKDKAINEELIDESSLPKVKANKAKINANTQKSKSDQTHPELQQASVTTRAGRTVKKPNRFNV